MNTIKIEKSNQNRKIRKITRNGKNKINTKLDKS